MSPEKKSNKIVTIVLAIIIIVAAITVIYISLPKNDKQNEENNEVEETTVFTVIYGNNQTNYSLNELVNLTSYAGMGGYRKNSGIIDGQGNYTGVSITTLVELTAGNIENYSIIATSNYKGKTENLTYNYSYILGNIDIYDPNNASNSTPIGNGGLTMVLAYKYEGNYLNESQGGTFEIAFLDQNGSITTAGQWWKSTYSIEIVQD